MKRLTSILFILMLAVISCGIRATPPPTPTAGVTQVPYIPTLTPIPRTQSVLSQPATLYTGPGNVNYEGLAELSGGTTVYPSGTYGDFVKVVVKDFAE